ncbi:SufD family Fe-S cluster assembly protein [Candidatus Gottesmanbacteria bacterium]|nr:SufD family Fe-S cluster assembly protein [Candidatus Gottesmanbacteria bacterium]
MKVFKLQEITQSKQQFAYTVKSNSSLMLVLVLAKSIDADVHVVVRLTGRGASAKVIGLVVGRGDHKITIHTEQIHEAPETTSNLLVKAALYDDAQFSYDGVIRVARAAQKSDAYQKNENLLLSPHAHARSDPALEILANDVRCTHGSTTGKLNEDQLWYLASRGLSPKQGEALLVRGFFQHAIAMISDTISREKVRRQLWQTL